MLLTQETWNKVKEFSIFELVNFFQNSALHIEIYLQNFHLKSDLILFSLYGFLHIEKWILETLEINGGTRRHQSNFQYGSRNGWKSSTKLKWKKFNYFSEMSFSYEFLIWALERKTSRALWKDVSGTESKYFNKANLIFFTNTLTDINNKVRSFFPLIFYLPSNNTTFYGRRESKFLGIFWYK